MTFNHVYLNNVDLNFTRPSSNNGGFPFFIGMAPTTMMGLHTSLHLHIFGATSMGIYEDPPSRGVVSFQERSPVAPRSGRKPLGIHNHQGTPHNNKKQSDGVVINKPLPRETTTTTSMPQQQPTSAQSFRRALRASLSPPPQGGAAPQPQIKQTTVVPKVSFSAVDDGNLLVESKPSNVPARGGLLTKRTSLLGALGPPQRVEPKTPNSLLRTELDFEADSSDLEESLLVSPPGAVWNALGAAHNPSSASSTRLLIVPPATAATIHTITSSHKKAARQPPPQPWRSPPLQSRSNLSSTPEEEDEQIPGAVQDSTPRGGVAMDLSSMFSQEKKSPPEQLLRRLQKPSPISSEENEMPETTAPQPPLTLGKSPRENPVAMDMSCMFFSLSSPPPRVWTKGFSDQRGSKPVDEAGGSNHVADIPAIKSPIVPQQDEPEKTCSKPTEEEVVQRATDEHDGGNNMVEGAGFPQSKSKGGVFLDMTNLFGDSSSNKAAQATPPPHLLERLSRKVAPTTKAVDKKESSTVRNSKLRATSSIPKIAIARQKANSTVPREPLAQSRPPLTNNRALAATNKPFKRSAPAAKTTIPKSNLRAGATRVVSTTQPIAVKIQRAPLQKNAKFFPSANDIVTQRATDKGVSFDIVAPSNETDNVRNRSVTSIKKQMTVRKIPSPIKITRDANDWAGKQCDTFVSWLNYTFHPDEDEDGDAASGLRALVMHRRLAQVRFRAAELFQSPTMRKVREAVQTEIARDRLTIRADRDLYADLSLRELATQLLLSYTTPWLRLGLEVMYGECIVLQESLQGEGDCGTSPVARMRAALRNFVVERVLSDSSVLMKYTKGRTKVPSGKFEKLYREEMRTLVLYRLMVLILFLDHLKMKNVLDKVPRLFTKSSEVKSSKAVLLSFCRNFLSSEGDFMKHLSRIGLEVSYVQDPIDELEFKLSNLAADLRDGANLTRMTEIITETPFKTLMRSLRLPAVSRLQKMHNVGVALTKLKDFGIMVPQDLNAHHIVDAHREMVLKLMWSVIAHVCMNKLLKEGQVAHEIENVLRSGKARRNMEGIKARSSQHLSPDKPTNSSSEEALRSLLFRWCKAVCSNFGLHLQDFTDSFANGKALCYLVHYYHPGSLRCEDILPTLNDEDAGLSEYQALLNERANSALAAKCVTELGGIPKMLPITDSRNPPDEKSMLLCLTYLCSRLMESSEEIFATILIQACYRRYRNKVLQEQKEAAARVIFRAWCDHKDQYYVAQQRRYAAAVAVVETFVLTHRHALERMKLHRLKRERQIAAITLIQRCFRGMIDREIFTNRLQQERSAIMIQKHYRRFIAELVALQAAMHRDAATRIQSVFRAWIAQNRFSVLVFSATELQRFARGYITRQERLTQDNAAKSIQKAWWKWVEYADQQVAAIFIQKVARGGLARRQYQDLLMQHHAAASIQKIWRGYLESTMFQLTVEFTIAIQKVFRGYVARKNLPIVHMSRAAILIQKTWRGFWAQVQFNMDILDVVAVQTLARARLAKAAFVRRYNAILCVQRALRVALARRALEREVAAGRIQCAFRVWRAKHHLDARRVIFMAATAIQSTWRRSRCRTYFVRAINAVILIESAYRGRVTRQMYTHCVQAACKIQRCFRAHMHRIIRVKSATLIQSQVRRMRDQTHFHKSRSSTIAIQSVLRGWMANKTYRDTLKAAVSLQTCWRRFSAQLNFELDLLEIVISQSVVRRMLAQHEAKKRRDSVQTLQNFVSRSFAYKERRLLQSRRADFVHRNGASIVIQRHIRGFLSRQYLSAHINAATFIQACSRMSKQRGSFATCRQAIVSLQAHFRGHMTRNKQVALHEAATTIQAVWRGHVHFIDFVISYGNIIIAQSFVRRFLAAKRALTRHTGLLKIQSICRRFLGIRRCQLLREKRRFEHRQNHAATIIQSLYRGALVRQDLWWKNSAATLIQAQYRGRMVRVFYALELYDITTVQAIARRWLASRLSKRKANSILIIQSVVRAWMARCTVSQVWAERQREIARIKAITRVQNSYRGYLVRRNIGALHRMTILIQKAFRCHYSYVAYKMLVVDVTIVQSQARLWLVKGWLSKANMSAVKIQSLVRRRFAARQASVLRTEKTLSEIQNLCALTLQRIWRGRVSRKISSRHSSARKIQKTWRCFTAHVEYLVQQISIIRLQRSIRKMRAVEKYNKTRIGFVRFQAAVRGYSTREYIRFISLSTIVVQAAFRKYAARKAYLQHIRGITHLQAIVRGVRVRDELEFWNFAACEIQRIWRGFTQFCDYVILVDATVKLQAFFRKTIAIRRFKELRLVLHVERSYYNHVTRSIQRSYRLYSHRKHLAEAAGVIQRRARFYIQMRRATIVDRGVRRVQAIWRAKIVRRLRSKKLSALVLRLDVANRKARNDPKLRIGYKTRHALEVLQNSKSLAGIMDAVKSLETSTRLSQLCCVLFTEAHAARILLDLIRSCNRSIPHMELVQCILLTLDNVSEYRALVPSFADCNSAEIFLDKMQMFRDKDGIFCLSISLLERISDCNPMVEEFCAMHEHLKRLKALHQLSLRRSITSTFSTKRNTKINRMKRRENFDRHIAVKALGLMTEKFDARSLATTAAPHSREHFTFKDSQCEN